MVINTIAGMHLLNLFPENVAFNIAQFLEETEEEHKVRQERMTFYNAMIQREIKGRRLPHFAKYSKNLRYSSEYVFSYHTPVISLYWDEGTAHRFGGKWSSTTSKHMNYALQNLRDTWGFKEIK